MKWCIFISLYFISCVHALRTPRILGGKPAVKGQFPWQALLWISKDPQIAPDVVLCGGALIERDVILTSGGCLFPGLERRDLNITVVLGSVNLNPSIDDISRVEIKTQSYKIYDFYDPFSRDDDFGLVFLKADVHLNEYIQIIPISNEKLEGGVNVTISGWGMVDDKPLDQLHYRDDLVTITNEECREKTGYLSDDDVCTISSTGTDVTKGDGGSALVAGFPDNPRHVGTPSLLGLDHIEHARTSVVFDWIIERIKSHRAEKNE